MVHLFARRRIKRWLVRYVPSEIAGTISALGVASVLYATTGSLGIAAIGGSIGETAGYYSIACAREVRNYMRRYRQQPSLHRVWLISYRTICGILLEFGPGELVDSLFVRPSLLYLLPQLFSQPELGWLVGKLFADIVFYGFAAIGYHVRQKILPEQQLNE